MADFQEGSEEAAKPPGADENGPRSGENGGAGGFEKDAPSGGKRKGRTYGDRPEGSYSFDDPVRPRWQRDTVLVAEYEYPRADGTYAYSVLKGRRTDGKKAFLRGRLFCDGMSELDIARREDPDEFYRFPGLEFYRKGAGGEPDLLFRLPKLIAALAARPDDDVHVTEGEKDADRLLSLGLIATTNPNGADNWKPEFNPYFAGRNVVVWIDNDKKGRDRAALIAAALWPVAKSIRLIELPDLRPNGDLSDWLDAGRTPEDLLRIVAETPPVTDLGDLASASGEFRKGKDGKPLLTPANARLALKKMGCSVSYNEFAQRYRVDGLEGFGPALDDAALIRLRLIAEERFRLPFAKERWADIITDYARRNTHHPVREYLDGLTWDKTGRLDCWLIEYGGAENTKFVRTVGALALIAAVRRVRQPGSKFDEMLVLESPQGTNKSSALAVLAVHADWFSDDLPLDADTKVVMERLAGRWIVEAAELKGMRRGEVEKVKAMLSRSVDKARMAYGRLPVEQPRQCVFFGTTNTDTYLRDSSGNRRFWPVKVNEFDLGKLRQDRDQLWAEAAVRESKGVSIRLPEELWAVAADAQAQRQTVDPFYEVLSQRLDELEGKVRCADLWYILKLDEAGKRSQDHNVRLGEAMQALGWKRDRLRFGEGKKEYCYTKGDAGTEVPCEKLFPAASTNDENAGEEAARDADEITRDDIAGEDYM